MLSLPVAPSSGSEPATSGRDGRRPTAERFIKTMLAERAYGRLYGTNLERSAALTAFVDFYNRRRPRSAIGGR